MDLTKWAQLPFSNRGDSTRGDNEADDDDDEKIGARMTSTTTAATTMANNDKDNKLVGEGRRGRRGGRSCRDTCKELAPSDPAKRPPRDRGGTLVD